MQNNPEDIQEHKFETDLINEAASGTGSRLPYEELSRQRSNLLTQTYIDAADKAKNPIFFFCQTRQLLHANAAALKEIVRKPIDECIGLRLGELFGCDHKMSSHPGEIYTCHDCNSMPSLRIALSGRHSVETRHLILHPDDNPSRAVFRISTVPVSAGNEHLAMMIFEKIDDAKS